MTETMGRRERKKAATRQALADAALELFLERGFDEVSIRDVAEAADVSTTTLFKHFPSKEALLFDMDADVESALVAAVRERSPDTSALQALRTHTLEMRTFKAQHQEQIAVFLRLINSTPALIEYHRRMWMRHERALAEAVAADLGAPADDPACAALAHLALEARALAGTSPDPEAAVNAAFDLLEKGWEAVRPGS
ncbi:AcrR family transcriptional regulator [Streptomyces griseochromogenes]|uniref:AcrR family transcriptional regulator n=1 Tax=Streptomyces griseochromogenes TaxID=68214 RepID=A0A1B1B8X3_9ACTN|nr:TetR/AcrR family transcriptional regulator [Streptomyces griseochromogenes]ANP55243.1 TetR family transcriptional regulator [Streptomyces griseochromogenes]MBP2050315.1 AcrR family transcriptional regulator [Streptomyces griseochromogenes]